ncbi:MAG: tetratricopeptide repeat protein [Pseudomonadales bacterium]|nr:tetratricopeptide repeat protein [Pseudomonadales bacterium]NIX08006.1 tetratricopeptide repeat protein [Pseudomonadales bacterium]
MGGYTTREVSDLIGLKPDQVRHYVRRSLLQPRRGDRGEYRFTFQDVVLLRSAKGLLDADVSPRKAYRVLLKLQSELSQVKSLAAVRIFADGNNVVVREDNQVWDVETGQGQLDFTVRELADNVATLAQQNLIVLRESDGLDSDEWYNLGLDLEEVDPDRAPDAYARAIELNPKNADAHVNLGRLMQLKGNLKFAKRHYEHALAAVSNHQLAFYNLGTVYDELDDMEKAAEYYRRAPAVPDAHFNLSRIYQMRGDEVSALRHMRQYRELLDVE